jgi:hypothetical protein
MFNRWIVVILVLAVFAAAPVLAQEYTARPHAIFIDKGKKRMRLRNFLMQHKNVDRETLIRNFRARLGAKNLTGFASLFTGAILDDLRGELAKGSGNPDKHPQGHPACRRAHYEKKNWHRKHGGEVPEAFGRIVGINLLHRGANRWVGRVDVCTWIGSRHEFYLRMVFFINGTRTMRLVKKQNGTFPGTLEPSAFEGMDMSQWGWKLHARGGSFGMLDAYKNGKPLDLRSDLFRLNPDDCFDLFLANRPPGTIDELPPQLNFCMGRCDARYMNTGE